MTYRKIGKARDLQEAGDDAEMEELRTYADSIKQDSGDIKKNYRAFFDFANAVSHIDRAAKGGGPKVQIMRARRLGMVKHRIGAQLDMMVRALKDVKEVR